MLDREKGFALTLISKFVEAVAKQAAATSSLVYDEAALKQKLAAAMQGEFAGMCSGARSLPEVVGRLFAVLNTSSIPKLDGIDTLLKESLNNIYTNPHITPIVKYSFFNSLVQKYEAFLKKLYYLLNGEELAGRDGKDPTLADSIHAFTCLWNLRYSADADGQKFSSYLQQLRDWRNNEAHNAPSTTEAEVDGAIRVVVSMYIYVTACCSDGIDGACHGGGGVRYLTAGGVPAATAAERRHTYRPDSGE